jgi:hypothetical protein
MRGHPAPLTDDASQDGAIVRRVARSALVLAALLIAVGCDDSRSPTAPTPSTGGSPPVAEPLTLTVTVTVQDFRKAPLAGALVDGGLRSELIASATTDADGRCELRVPPSAWLRAQKDGYDPEVVVLPTSSTSAIITLYRRRGPGELIGSYSLAVQPSPTCTALGAHQLVYNARVETWEGLVFVILGPPDRVVTWGGDTGFTGTREGARIRFVIRDTFDDGYNFIGRHPALGDVYYRGAAVAEHAGGAIVGVFDGEIRTSASNCQATDHRLEFTPCSPRDWGCWLN